MKIAILGCRNRVKSCTMASCLTASRNCTGTFACYQESPELAAVLDCGGCPEDYDAAAMQKKLTKLNSEGVECIHLTGCVKEDCPRREELLSELEDFGMKAVFRA